MLFSMRKKNDSERKNNSQVPDSAYFLFKGTKVNNSHIKNTGM